MTKQHPSTANHKPDLMGKTLCIVGVFGMIIMSYLPFITPYGRPIAEQSEQNQTLLVPLGFAFSIWGPIFLGCIGYALYQFKANYHPTPVMRRVRQWSSLGFLGVCLWTYFSSFGPQNLQKWGTAIVFIPTMLCFVKAMLLINRPKQTLSAIETWLCWLPISLIAGWTSLAVFLNWAPLADDLGYKLGWGETQTALSVLGVATLWAAYITFTSKGNLAYSGPIIWGLAFLAIARFNGANGFTNVTLAFAAIVALAVLFAITVIAAKSRSEPQI